MWAIAIKLPLVAWVSGDVTRRAVEIATVGMLMVFAALALLCGFLALLPWILAQVNALWPETADHRAPVDAAVPLLDDEDEVLAAIGLIMHAQAQDKP
jgi:Na+-transporting methylmalonyl-CoA/oxaloacetate decarboxylase gamma subunit